MPAGTPPPRILILRVGAMGDIVHALPAVAQLRAHLPSAFLGWAVEPRWSALLQADAAAPGTPGMPLVDHLHPVPTRDWSRRPFSLSTLRSILALRRHLRAGRYTLAVDLQGSLRSAILARLSGAPVIVGPAAPREAPARWLYTHRIPTPAPHVIDQACQLAQAALDLLPATHPPGPPLASSASLPVDAIAEAWAATTLPPAEGPTVLLAPTAGWGAKQWPADRFGQLAASLAQHGCRVLINSAGLTDTTAHAVLQAAHAALPATLHAQVGALPATLPQLLALLRHTRLVIAGDTGPLHLAASLGIPTVALFGPTDPARTGPFANPAIILRDPASVIDHRRHATAEAGLQRISVATVLAAALTLLNAPPSPGNAKIDRPAHHGGTERS